MAFICDIMNVVADLAEDFAEVERELSESVRYVECMACSVLASVLVCVTALGTLISSGKLV